MKKLILTLALLALSVPAWAQTEGPFPFGQFGGNTASDITYTWGVIGDTSTCWTCAPSWDTQSAVPVDMVITGTTAYTANGYSEGGKNESSFPLSTPQQPTALNNAGYLDEDQFVTTDGINVYYAQIGSGWPASVPYVMGWNIATNGYYTFPSGTVPTDGTTVPSVIDSGNVASGIAVQTAGNFLAVAHAAANQIVLFNKTSGAQTSTLSVTSPGRMAYSPGGVLWYISGVTVSNGTVTLPGLVAPLTVAVDPNNSNVLVADGGSSQQVKTFSATGTLLSTYGVLGGYTDCSPTVTKTRLWLDNTAGLGYVKQTLLAVAPDSSFWVGDPGNARVLHISSTGTYIEEISFLRYLYYVAIDHQNPSRVFADALEFSVNYSIPLVPGDGSGGAWSLVRNWAACVPSGYTGQFGFRFYQVQTLPNGLTYGMLFNATTSVNELVQLPSSGPMLRSGVSLMQNPYAPQLFDHSGNLVSWSYTPGTSANQLAYSSPLTGYDGSNWPTYGTAVLVASVPDTGGANTPAGYFGWGMAWPAIATTSGYYPTYNPSPGTTPGSDKHLGAVLAGGTNWSWTAAPGADLVNPDGLGTFEDDVAYGGHDGIAVFSEGKYILQGYDGQWGTFASQWFLYGEAGNFIHQFGHGFTLPAPSDGSEYPAAAGNIWTMGTAAAGNCIYLVNSDEGYHPGVHLTKVCNLPSSVGSTAKFSFVGAQTPVACTSTNTCSTVSFTPGAGHELAICAYTNNPTVATTLTLSGMGSNTVAGVATNPEDLTEASGYYQNLYCWYVLSATASSITPTINASATTSYLGILVSEFSSTSAATYDYSAAFETTSGVTACSTSAISTAGDNELLLAFYGANAGGLSTTIAGGSPNAWVQSGQAGPNYDGVYYQLNAAQVTSQTYSVGTTIGACVSQILALK